MTPDADIDPFPRSSRPAPVSRDARVRRGMRSGPTGRAAEDAAARRYQRAGFEVLARNWRAERLHGGGEIDLIARRGDLVAFVEVKARRTLDEAAAALRPAQLRRLAAAALRWMEISGPDGCDMRIDLAACDRGGGMAIMPNVTME